MRRSRLKRKPVIRETRLPKYASMGRVKRGANLQKIKELFDELEGYRDMDLHDAGVIDELKGVVADLKGAGYRITFEEAVEILTRDPEEFGW